MRLMNAKTYEIHEFLSEDEDRRYAILSHTWGDEECTLQHMTTASNVMAQKVMARKGYAKIKYCCEQAKQDGLEWVCCCIDKTSTAELSEAINSMFRWYRNAAICYTYLVDVASLSDLRHSRWFTRGWTLQELIAPKDVRFYSSDWQCLGSKHKLQNRLWRITGIDQSVLLTGMFDQVCIAKRMSWAANRQTTRVEDWAYSLMGIFDVNMPLLYGEGKKSFIRLQEEIMKISDDHTLFAWDLPATLTTMEEFSKAKPDHSRSQLHGLLADSPADFASKREIQALGFLQSDMPPIVFNNGVRIELPIFSKGLVKYAAISCTAYGHYDFYLGIPLLHWSERYVARCGDLVLIPAGDWSSVCLEIKNKEFLLIKPPPSTPTPPTGHTSFRIMSPYVLGQDRRAFLFLDDVHCLENVRYCRDSLTIESSISRPGLYAALFFTLKHRYGEMGPAFAIVIGSDIDGFPGPEAAFVLLSPSDCSEEEAPYHLVYNDERSMRYRMTKSQLISQLDEDNNGMLFLQETVFRLHQDQKVLRVVRGRGYWPDGTEDIHPSRKLKMMELCVQFHEAPINLLEQGIIVCIELVQDGVSSSTIPNWWDRHLIIAPHA